MTNTLQAAFAVMLSGLAAATADAQKQEDPSMADCPMMKEHAAMHDRGDNAMGFSHEKTTHHFTLAPDGGAIEVAANALADEANQEQIRGLSHIAKLFAEGNFQIPMLVHHKMPDGADVMKESKGAISYTYQETEAGARVRIRTSDAKALQAIHQFLRFQITEHQTGDSPEVPNKR